MKSSPASCRLTTPTTATRSHSRQGLLHPPDRPDIGYAVKESAHNMSNPRASDFQKLRKIGRYLGGKPHLIMRFPWQDISDIIVAFTDSDWAGGARSAKSTTRGGGLFWGTRFENVLQTAESHSPEFSGGSTICHGRSLGRGIGNSCIFAGSGTRPCSRDVLR